MPPHNCETQQAVILSPNNHCKERHFLPGLKAGISMPNI